MTEDQAAQSHYTPELWPSIFKQPCLVTCHLTHVVSEEAETVQSRRESDTQKIFSVEQTASSFHAN